MKKGSNPPPPAGVKPKPSQNPPPVGDFETHPRGTQKRLDDLEEVCRQTANVLCLLGYRRGIARSPADISLQLLDASLQELGIEVPQNAGLLHR